MGAALEVASSLPLIILFVFLVRDPTAGSHLLVKYSFGSDDLGDGGGGGSGESGCGSGTLNSGNYHPSKASILRIGRGQLKSKNSISKIWGL